MIATLASQKNTGPKPGPKFWIWVTTAYTATTLLFFLKSKSYQNEILQILWTDDTQFHQLVPSFAHFTATLKLGMKQGLQG